MTLLSLDLGTTHCKAALFTEQGKILAFASRPNPTHLSGHGFEIYDPQELWKSVTSLSGEVLAGFPPSSPVQAIGIASMAETGLLVDAHSGAELTPLFPWFEPSATPQAEQLNSRPDAAERFYRCGVRPSFKCSLARLMWLREQDPTLLEGATWLDVAGYVAYRLSGVAATDYTLAGRSNAFHIYEKVWDEAILASLGLSGILFPPAYPSGRPLGGVACEEKLFASLRGVPVAIAGHDHISAAFAASLAVGGLQSGLAFDSLGTAEPLVSAIPERRLGEAEYRSGLSYGCHVLPGYQYWIGGLSASGGSIEWLRSLLGDPPLAYEELDGLLEKGSRPTGILYFPYLAGSGSPHTDSLARGAFIGLSSSHSRGDLYKAVLEGTAYELEFIRRTAEKATGVPIRRIVAAGGGARNAAWMQVKADVFGQPIEVLGQVEATLLGAAMLAGLGCGAISEEDTMQSLHAEVLETYQPDAARHRAYQRLYEEGFLGLQAALRRYYRGNE